MLEFVYFTNILELIIPLLIDGGLYTNSSVQLQHFLMLPNNATVAVNIFAFNANHSKGDAKCGGTDGGDSISI